MRIASTWIPALVIAGAAHAQLQLLPDAQPQAVFGGEVCTLELRWRNSGTDTASADINARIFQASESTVMPLSQRHWKTMTVLPGQTVLESAQLQFPTVNAQVHFVVQWWGGTNRMLGTTEVFVHSTNLLMQLRALVGEAGTLGIFDPSERLKLLLVRLGMRFQDLADSGVAGFRGRLAILGLFDSKDDMPADLAERVELVAGKGVAVVWLLPPPGPKDKLHPSFESMVAGTNAVVMVQHDLVADLATNPQSQLNLLHCCRLALHPELPRLPYLTQ